MKIAVLISGHMRNYSSCLENQYTHLFNLNAGKEKNNLTSVVKRAIMKRRGQASPFFCYYFPFPCLSISADLMLI